MDNPCRGVDRTIYISRKTFSIGEEQGENRLWWWKVSAEVLVWQGQPFPCCNPDKIHTQFLSWCSRELYHEVPWGGQLLPPLKSFWILWSQCSSSLNLHRHLLSTLLHDYEAFAWCWVGGEAWEATALWIRTRLWMQVSGPLFRMLDLQWFIQNYGISIRISKVALYLNPEANYLWIRNSSQIPIKMKTNHSPPYYV